MQKYNPPSQAKQFHCVLQSKTEILGTAGGHALVFDGYRGTSGVDYLLLLLLLTCSLIMLVSLNRQPLLASSVFRGVFRVRTLPVWEK